jgi:hypothetical protein|tara:strand:+ start:799 stop:1455 length:657 start_codon:yes stop_codon:yes gene_type:complete
MNKIKTNLKIGKDIGKEIVRDISIYLHKEFKKSYDILKRPLIGFLPEKYQKSYFAKDNLVHQGDFISLKPNKFSKLEADLKNSFVRSSSEQIIDWCSHKWIGTNIKLSSLLEMYATYYLYDEAQIIGAIGGAILGLDALYRFKLSGGTDTKHISGAYGFAGCNYEVIRDGSNKGILPLELLVSLSEKLSESKLGGYIRNEYEIAKDGENEGNESDKEF